MKSKSLVPLLPYLAVSAGLFLFKSAWAALIGFYIAILFALFILRPTLPLNVLIKPATMTFILINILLGAAGGLGLYLLRDVFAITNDLGAQLEAIGWNQSTWFGLTAYFTLANPFIEEYFWRGVLGSGTKGFYFGDLVYAGYHVMVVWNKTHLFSMVFMLAILTFVGWYWRQLYRRDGSLLAPVLGHMAADLSILIAVHKMA